MDVSDVRVLQGIKFDLELGLRLGLDKKRRRHYKKILPKIEPIPKQTHVKRMDTVYIPAASSHWKNWRWHNLEGLRLSHCAALKSFFRHKMKMSEGRVFIF
jgi:hypothetical protein